MFELLLFAGGVANSWLDLVRDYVLLAVLAS